MRIILLHRRSLPSFRILHLLLLCFLFSSHCFRLIKWVLHPPFNTNGFSCSFSQYLIHHSLSCEFCKISMPILNISMALLTIEMDIFNLSPGRKELIDNPYHISYGSLSVSWQHNICDMKCPAFFVERSNSCKVLLVSCMPCSSKNISQIVFISLL